MTLQSLSIDLVKVSDTHAQNRRRKAFKKEETQELAQSISTHGVMQPIIVRETIDDDGQKSLTIVAGERRFLAAKMAGLDAIPAIVKTMTDEEVIHVQLTENLQRTDLHPMEEAEGYQELIQKHGYPVERIHEQVGKKSRSYVYKRLKLLELCKEARNAFFDDRIGLSQALLLARVPNKKLQIEALEIMIDPWERMTFKESLKLIQDDYMLSMHKAPFDIHDENLVSSAGSCSKCPKLTTNQPELFDDIAKKSMCTDPTCYKEKRTAYSRQVAEKFKSEGFKVHEGEAAKKIFNNGHLKTNKLVDLDDTNYNDRKYRTNRQILSNDLKGVDVELLIDDAGISHELVPTSVINKALKIKSSSSDNTERDRKRKIKIERAYRMQLYKRARSEAIDCVYPSDLDICEYMLERLNREERKLLAEIRDFKPKKDSWGALDYSGIVRTLKALDDDGLILFMLDCMIVGDLIAPTYSAAKPERLLELARELNIDPRAVRAEINKQFKPKVKAKTKAKAKAKAKKPTTKKA